jgi:hypothetical protein
MKYIVGAGIGGLFGLSVPLMIETQQIENKEDPRQEVPQQVEEEPPVLIEGSLILPDNVCGYINYESADIKEQAKECLDVDIPAMPAI